MNGNLDGIFELRSSDPRYPRPLLHLASPPEPIFVAGSIDDRDAGGVAVVGSRRASQGAREAARLIGRALASDRRTVVSGLAEGVDAGAHRGALSVDSGRTIAVVGTGLWHTYPPRNASLERQIRTRGAVLSQYPLDQGPRPEAFARRNELIAALAVATIVVVAEERSGTRYTIDFTIEQKKPVILWGPLMAQADWARELVLRGYALFARDVSEAIALAATSRNRNWTLK
jgi:DNA processing protein